MNRPLQLSMLLTVGLLALASAPQADAQAAKAPAAKAAPPAQAVPAPPSTHDEGTLEVTSDRDLEW